MYLQYHLAHEDELVQGATLIALNHLITLRPSILSELDQRILFDQIGSIIHECAESYTKEEKDSIVGHSALHLLIHLADIGQHSFTYNSRLMELLKRVGA